MTWEELKKAVMDYVDSKSGEDPGEEDLKMLEAISDFELPEIDEEAVNARIEAAVAANSAEWAKRYKDRFYSTDAEETEVTEPEVISNEPEEEVEKSILDYEW